VLSVTLAAKLELDDLLDQVLGLESVEGASFRLVAGPTDDDGAVASLELQLDRPRDGDEVVEHRGRGVLVVDDASSDFLSGLTLDVVETPEGRALTLRQYRE
jgi:Fe-S cluster assembly iron-binding protein IscA